MKQALIILFLILGPITGTAQTNYGNPPEQLLPDKLKGIPQALVVSHFPEQVDAVKIEDTFFWKHNTALLSLDSNITIIEYGAYIYYNDQWNLRRTYPMAEFDTYFGTQDQLMLQGQPYTWNNNWRSGNALFAGWALWYFIGENEAGQTVCGYQRIYTSDSQLN